VATIDEVLAAAVADHRAGRLAEAAARYRQVLAVDAANADALHLLGLTERHEGRTEVAVALIVRAIQLNPALVDARLNLANILRQQGRPAAAAAVLRQAVAMEPGHAGAWSALGAVLLDQGPCAAQEAVEALARAARLEPARAEAHHDLGLALRRVERLDAAVASHRRAVRARPDFVAARMNLGNALLERGDAASAAMSLRTAVALLPDSPECLYNLGNARMAQGDAEGALSCYRRSARLGLGAARTQVAGALIALERPDAALAVLLDGLGRAGTDVPVAIEMLSGLLIRQGRLAEGRALFARIAELRFGGASYPAECLTALAAIELREGRPEAAASLLSRVQGDNGWFFTVKSLAHLHASLGERGLRLERPPPLAPGDPRGRVTSSTLAAKGRFAHTVMEYVLVRLHAEKHGLVLETPDWVGGTFFDLDDPPQGAPLPPLLFPRRLLNDQLDDELDSRGGRPPVAGRDLLSPLFLFRHREAYRTRVQSWLRPRAQWLPYLDPALERLRGLGATVVAVHLRRGDFVRAGYPITRTDWYVDWLRALWPTLDRPVLYLASDDLPAVADAFAEFRPLSRADVAPAWEGLEFLQDFHVLMHADVVGVSASSGFSQLAARLNSRARIFAEPDLATRRVRPFVPWTD